MEKFIRHSGRVIPMNRANVDTDAIMPKQYLKCISRYGYGDWVFDSWRYLDPGDVDTPISQRRINPEFELNKPIYRSASVLLAQNNFGCGSSREHAVWGLRDYGIKVIIAPGFPDIFLNNCFANGLLPVRLEQQDVNRLFDLAESDHGLSITIDLDSQDLEFESQKINFKIDENSRQSLIKGYDSIEATLQQSKKIETFERRYFNQYSWLEVDLK
ncbi:MAG: 3-isopropylmalate dehydratase small subunit [Gammaproteobacteria bacterium]|nr:3-isopropylmalate dehydratase small subunit [Gammaproteobacteria bacterium]